MRSIAVLILILLCSPRLGAQESPSPTPSGDDWVLIWEEAFDARDAAFDERWDIGTHTFGGNEAHFNPANVIVEDGVLKLRLTDEPYGERAYSGAELRTDNEIGFFTYGRFEARMKAASGSGVISSLFTYRYQPWQEIDIEFKGRDTRAMQANIFYNGGQAGDPNNEPYEVPPFPEDVPLPYDAAEEFHVYAFEWEPGIIRWFIDGVQVLESQDPVQVPYLPQQLMMNIWATNLAWAGPFDPTALPAEAQYDWVRVYRRASEAFVFETFDDGDLSDVFVFSETGAGVSVEPTTDAGGVPGRAAAVRITPSGAGSYGGAVFSGGPGVADASQATALTFQLRPDVQAGNLPLTVEVNLHEDVNGNGVYDGDIEDEYQALYTVLGPSDYVDVSIPFSEFVDDNVVFPGANDGFDYARLLEIVVAVAGLTGPEYTLSFDEFGFAPPTTATEQPSGAVAGAPVVYPNPTTGRAMAVIQLATPSVVTVDVLDVLGRRVATLLNGAQPAGTVRLVVPADTFAPGMYILRVQTETTVSLARMSVVR